MSTRLDEIARFKDVQAWKATVRAFNVAGFNIVHIDDTFLTYEEFDDGVDNIHVIGTVDVTDLVTEKFIQFRADTTDSNMIVTAIADKPRTYDLIFSKGTKYVVHLGVG